MPTSTQNGKTATTQKGSSAKGNKDDSAPKQRNITADVISYCIDTKEYLDLKNTIEVTRKRPDYELRSAGEMKELMGEMVEDVLDMLKKREENIEKMSVDNRSQDGKEKLDNLKSNGLKEIYNIKERVFKLVSDFFSDIEEQWTDLFEFYSTAQRIKNEALESTQQKIKEYTEAKGNYRQLVDNQPNVTFVDLAPIIGKVETYPKDMEVLDKKMQELTVCVKKISGLNLQPKIVLNEKAFDGLQDQLQSL